MYRHEFCKVDQALEGIVLKIKLINLRSDNALESFEREQIC